MLQKSETNNAIVTTLANVRKHPNADRIKLATVLGTQVIVGLEVKNGDIVIYFDSNLRLSPEYLHYNNLYSNPEMNANKAVKGYFGKNGRVQAQRFRGEVSNGYVAEIGSLVFPGTIQNCNEIDLQIGDEFTHINGASICEKYIIPEIPPHRSNHYKKWTVPSHMFHKHWETKQLMREKNEIPPGILYIEEKIHGTSGRTANVLCSMRKRWWQLWKKPQQYWRTVSGTRNVGSIDGHMVVERGEIEEKLAPHLYKGEQVYYEIYGHQEDGKQIQPKFSYGCVGGQYKVMLYRVTITTPDGKCYDLNREQVYKRAEELGLEKPVLLRKVFYLEGYYSPATKSDGLSSELENIINIFCKGKSAIDTNTLREGIVVWFKTKDGNWNCLKHKSEEFLILESKQKNEGISDVEDVCDEQELVR